MLSAFGTYWTGEGLGLAWPGSDASLLFLIAIFLATGWLVVRACRRLRTARPPAAAHNASHSSGPDSRLAKIGAELMGLFVDDLWFAIGLCAWVGLTAVALSLDARALVPSSALFPAGLASVLAASACRKTLAAADAGSTRAPDGGETVSRLRFGRQAEGNLMIAQEWEVSREHVFRTLRPGLAPGSDRWR